MMGFIYRNPLVGFGLAGLLTVSAFTGTVALAQTDPDEPLVLTDQGPTGPQGNQGIPGRPGDQGPPGSDGADGSDGVDGVDGTDGSNGLNGVTVFGPAGADGTDGATGPPGPEGPPGPPSTDFACPAGFSPQEVVFNSPGGQLTLLVCVAG